MALAQAAPDVKAVGPLKPAPKILVLSGGGVLGIAEMGVIDALKHHNLTDEIEIVAGTSIGSLVGLGLALNSPEQHYIKKLLSGEVDLREFPDKFPAEYEVKPKDPSYVKCAKYLYNGGLSLFNKIKSSLPSNYNVKGTDPHLVAHGKAMLKPLHATGTTLLKLANAARDAKTGYQKKGLYQGKYIEDTVKRITSEMVTTHKLCLEQKLQMACKDDGIKEKILADRKLLAPTSEMKDVDAALIKLQDIVAGKATLTFGALHLIRLLAPELHLKDLVVTATNVRTKPLTVEYLSHETYPDMPIATAIHASMAVPGAYAPVQYNDKLFNDGALDNTPYKHFQHQKHTKDMPFLAVDFGIPPEQVKEDKSRMSTLKYATQHAAYHFDAQKSQRAPEDHEHILYLHGLKASMLNFDISPKEQNELYVKGYAQAEAFLEKRNYIPPQAPAQTAVASSDKPMQPSR